MGINILRNFWSSKASLSCYQTLKIFEAKEFSMYYGHSEDILDKIGDLLKVKPDCLLLHVGTNDLTNYVNFLNSVKKMVKKVKSSSPNTKLVFSSVILRKDKKDISKNVGETNQRLKTIVNKKILILLITVIL